MSGREMQFVVIEAIRGATRGAVRGHRRGHPRPSVVIRGHPRPSEAIRGGIDAPRALVGAHVGHSAAHGRREEPWNREGQTVGRCQ